VSAGRGARVARGRSPGRAILGRVTAPPTHIAPAALAGLLLASLTGCRSTWYDYAFAPAPQEARVTDANVPGSQVRALVTLVGIRRPHDGEPGRVELRMRLENLGTVPVKLVPEGLELVGADLRSLGPASLAPEEADLAPGEARVYDVAFDLDGSPSEHDFGGVAFKWVLDFGGGPVPTSMNFQRVPGYAGDSYVHTQVGIGIGYVH
jgi:hypothetical protein